MFDVPNTGTQWMNGIANPLRWSKGLLDGVNAMDVELARLSTDGLLKVALNGTLPSPSLVFSQLIDAI